MKNKTKTKTKKQMVYASVETVHHMTIDSQASQLDDVKISLHASFFHIKCDDMELDMEATRGDSDRVKNSCFFFLSLSSQIIIAPY